MDSLLEHQDVELTNMMLNPVDFLDGMIQKHHEEFIQIELEHKKLQERRNELKQINKDQAKKIEELKKELLEKRNQSYHSPKGTGGNKNVTPRRVESPVESNDVSMLMDEEYTEIPAVLGNDDTHMIVMETLHVINEVVEVKQESMPREIPIHPVVLESYPIDIESLEDQRILNEMKVLVEQFHEGIQWSDRAVVITKLYNVADEDANKQIFLVTCPECSKKLMICHKTIPNGADVNIIVNYEQHIINHHIF